jgi:hypothetical protein
MNKPLKRWWLVSMVSSAKFQLEIANGTSRTESEHSFKLRGGSKP